MAANVLMAVRTSDETAVGAVTPLLTVAFAAAMMRELPVLVDATLTSNSRKARIFWKSGRGFKLGGFLRAPWISSKEIMRFILTKDVASARTDGGA